MQEQTFLTVAEFADRAGITTQAVYQRIPKDLGKYCKVEHGKKVIDSAALKLFSGAKDDDTGAESTRESGQTPAETEETRQAQAELIESLKIQNLQLAKENERILDLLQEERKLVQEKDEMIASLTKKLVAMVETEQELTKKALQAAEQAQFLHAVSENALEPPAESENGEPEKRGFLGLFRKKK